MELYKQGEHYTLYNGSMLELNNVIADNSIDSIVCDPPYELGFMGKSWDSSGIAFNPDTWKTCYNALKSGGYLLAFGGSRTYHRIACAIEDAGFEIRDTIMWIYGCYSADTQVLTDKGWKYFYDLDKTEKILQWDKDTNKLSWVKPLNYFEYDIDDEMCLFENRHISQLVTKNHKVAVSVKKRRKDYEPYELLDADSLYTNRSWNLKFPMAGLLEGGKHVDNAYIIGWWLTDAWKHGDGKAIMFSQSKPKTLTKLRNWLIEHNIKYSEYIKKSDNPKHKDEHTFYVADGLADELLNNYPNRELTWDVLTWDVDSRIALLEGLMDGDGSYKDKQYAKCFWSKNQERLDIFQALCISLGYRAYINHKYGVEFNTFHSSTEIQHKHRQPYVHYVGKVYCLQTKTGAFVVRRNGKAFISGNSGFPKSMNIGLAIDKKNGVESKVVGSNGTMPDFQDAGKKNSVNKIGINDGDSADRKDYYIYKAQNEWGGWGTTLKPAYEPIIVARKPCEGSTTDNVLKYGVGGINIDECRVPISDSDIETINAKSSKNPTDNYNNNEAKKYGDYALNIATTANQLGRFPANVILTYDESDYDEVCGGFPQTSSTGGKIIHKDFSKHEGSMMHFTTQDGDAERYDNEYFAPNDSGSASRYFYCAKASKRDRDEGLDAFEAKDCGVGALRDGGRDNTIHKRNTHPTVKPCDLMQYLVRLVTPNGGTVLDPFNGSGSTGKAVLYENLDRDKDYKYIGIELEREYCEISSARLDYVENLLKQPKQLSLFDTLTI